MDWRFITIIGITFLVLAGAFLLVVYWPWGGGSHWSLDLSDKDLKAINDASTIAACLAASTVIIS